MQFFIVVQEVCQEILLIVLFQTIELLLISHYRVNYFEKPYEALELDYQLVIIYVENYSIIRITNNV